VEGKKSAVGRGGNLSLGEGARLGTATKELGRFTGGCGQRRIKEKDDEERECCSTDKEKRRLMAFQKEGDWRDSCRGIFLDRTIEVFNHDRRL